MKAIFIFLLVSGNFIYGVYGQIGDTVHLEEVHVTTRNIYKYQAGTKLERFDSTVLINNTSSNLEKLLSINSPIYIKGSAGGLSTIHFRGTSPDHTSINFGGLNINSLTLGHSNTANIGIYLFDDISVQYGSASALNGSGSIGGSIYLGSSSTWEKGIKKEMNLTVGSFGEKMIGAKFKYGTGKLETKTAFYHYKIENDFPFKNHEYRDFSTHTFEIEDIQRFAKVENMALLQEFNFRISNNSSITNKLWVENDWHQVQPDMDSNLDSTLLIPEVLEDDHIRFWSQYNYSKQNQNFHVGIGYVHDYEVFNKLNDQFVGTDRFVADLGLEQDWDNSGFRVGVKHRYIDPNVYSYSDSVIKNEHHSELYFSYYKWIFTRLKITTNFRQMIVTDFKVPFTPAVGLEYGLILTDNSKINILGNISRVFRVPTFNDRYWGKQGNPYLKPEDGIHSELGLNQYWCKDNYSMQHKINVFYLDIKDWIEWRNKTDWEATNLFEVVSKGIEFQSKHDYHFGKSILNAGVNYSFNIVEAIKAYSETDIINRQLSYSPKHTGNTWIGFQRKNWKLNAYGKYTGLRYSDYVGNSLPSYFLLDVNSSYLLRIKNQRFRFVFHINNVTNTSYENEAYYAMPGITYKFSIIYN